MLVALLVLAAVGAGRVLPLRPVGAVRRRARLLVDAYLGERLLIGQWAVLIGYAALAVGGPGRGDASARGRARLAAVWSPGWRLGELWAAGPPG